MWWAQLLNQIAAIHATGAPAPVAPTTADYLVIAGGGSGGTNASGGGGAGGYRTSTGFSLGASFTVTVGAGGASTASGSNSVFSSITSTGGGRGASFGNSYVGANGGSGGGGGWGGLRQQVQLHHQVKETMAVQVQVVAQAAVAAVLVQQEFRALQVRQMVEMV
jgi:hypothetical protein